MAAKGADTLKYGYPFYYSSKIGFVLPCTKEEWLKKILPFNIISVVVTLFLYVSLARAFRSSFPLLKKYYLDAIILVFISEIIIGASRYVFYKYLLKLPQMTYSEARLVREKERSEKEFKYYPFIIYKKIGFLLPKQGKQYWLKVFPTLISSLFGGIFLLPVWYPIISLLPFCNNLNYFVIETTVMVITSMLVSYVLVNYISFRYIFRFPIIRNGA